ncbi:MAG: hypothetical protein JNL21_40675 [Myxococcales bacterium]|nr:hypothetical protein [Myxococcales bacterium]
MKRNVGLLLALALSAPSFAYADVAPEPCDGKEEGDACETSSGKSGTCNDSGVCEADGDGCSASSGSMRGAAPGLAIVAGAALAFVVARRRRPG